MTLMVPNVYGQKTKNPAQSGWMVNVGRRLHQDWYRGLFRRPLQCFRLFLTCLSWAFFGWGGGFGGVLGRGLITSLLMRSFSCNLPRSWCYTAWCSWDSAWILWAVRKRRCCTDHGQVAWLNVHLLCWLKSGLVRVRPSRGDITRDPFDQLQLSVRQFATGFLESPLRLTCVVTDFEMCIF